MPLRRFEGHAPKIAATVYIDDTALIIGNVEIGEDSSIWPYVVIRGDVHSIRIGKRCSVQDGSVIHVTHPGLYHPEGFLTTVGNDVTVGHKVVLHGCAIADHCLIGMGSILMDGAVVESHVIIGAGTLVPPGKVLEGGYLYMGAPAKCIRKLTEQEHEQLAYSASHYVELKNRHQGKNIP